MFNNFFPQLKEFYFYYYLPSLIKYTIDKKNYKWCPLNEINFLDNGLVNDISYYKNGNYMVSIFQNLDSKSTIVKELLANDFCTLNDNKWLSNFVVDLGMNLINENNIFQIIPTQLSNIIFQELTICDKFFFEKIKINRDLIAMPFLQNNNHFCLIIINFNLKKFSFINPFNSNTDETNIYLTKYKKFMQKYNNFFKNDCKTANSLSPLIYEHYKQEDNFNCGPIILNLFERIVKNKNLSQSCNLMQYRKKLKEMFLQKSHEVSDKCLICGRNSIELKSQKRLYCKRKIHNNCMNGY